MKPGELPDLERVPLFPLGTVLFPGGVLPLRIFEARYVDMVRVCMRGGTAFAVCLITRGNEVGVPADHELTGCLASIVDFDAEAGGLLRLRTVGLQRVRVIEREVEPNGLIRAGVRRIDDDPRAPVPEAMAACVQLVRRIVQDLVEREPDASLRMVNPPYDYESAAWVGNRLCEFLPIPPRARQKLMELDDPVARLEVVHEYLQRHQVL